MSESVDLKGIILRTSPVREYDRRVVILTGESGRITAFARGARRQGSKLMGSTEPLCFGNFKLIPGRDAYSLIDCNISRYFEELRMDYDAYSYAAYFMEIAEYYSRENLEAYQEVNLIYASLAALISSSFDNCLVRCIYELRSLTLAGEFPGIPDDRAYLDATGYTVERIVSLPLKELYSFNVSDAVLQELTHISSYLMKNVVGHAFKSEGLIMNPSHSGI